MRTCRTSPGAESDCRTAASGAPGRRRAARSGRLGDESGVVLVVIILMIALMLSLGAAGTRTAQIELRIAGNDVMSKQALEIAEAGWNHAYGLIQREDALTRLNGAANGFNDELSAGGTGGALAALGSLRMLPDGNSYRFAQTSAQTGTCDGYYVRIVDNQDETAGVNDPTVDVDNKIHIVSHGRVGTAERVIETIVERDATAPCVICGNTDFLLPVLDVTLGPVVTTDSFDSRSGPYDPAAALDNGHVVSNGDVSLVGAPAGSGIIVNGNVTASKGVLQLQKVDVTGSTTPNAPPTAFAPVLPCGSPFPLNTGMSGSGYIYDRTLGTLIGAANSVIDFAPGEYCFSSIVMAGGSTLRVSGPTRISTTLPSTLVGVVNTTGVASNLRFESSLVSPIPTLPVVPALEIVGVGGNISMVINAPNAVVGFAGATTNFFGQIIGGMIPSLLIAQLHYDEALNSPRLHRRGWRELRDYPLRASEP
jgi:hypothetical protein